MIEINNLSFSYKVGKGAKKQDIHVLERNTFTINDGEMVSIVGRSGSGKSTLLSLLAGFMPLSEGSIRFDGREVMTFSEKEWALFRLEHIGFVFQNFQLISSATVFDNVELPLILKGVSMKERKKRVIDILQEVGLKDHQKHFPNELSGGQQQRVGIARAIITNPKYVFADEPTGSLDTNTEREVLAILKKLNQERKMTFVMITHDEEVAAIADRTLLLEDGELQSGGEQHAI
ncbi:ABC transporter ATP-binding protein [Halalkalibacter sp. APA_J-10(15)]|uniref:ABC transporter ATP-binding protein n=1 Tax=Halalkalibacter sp. APA_J-10(15) TaxID=2933805 RepID=UPI001FF1E708|nr:ABC transporter ATP-binding protein [Halalkalibacter sp. APA_J-10(15)]MCK0472766.1 ABC transporter ATP-binding protein [Halalkalibacter sp. APA_J-10(15)]